MSNPFTDNDPNDPFADRVQTSDRPTPETDAADLEAHIGVVSFDESDIAKAFDFARNLERERDKLRAEVERAEAKTAAEYEAHRMTQCERDALRAEVERLKQLLDDCVSEGQEVEAALPSGVAGTWKQRVLAGVERLKAENVTLRNAQLCCEICDETVTVDKIRELRADKTRLDWLELNGDDLMTTNGKWVVMTGRCMNATETSVREAIDAAMKGDK